MRTATVAIEGKEFTVSALSCDELEALMKVHIELQKVIEVEPTDVRALLNFQRRMLDLLYKSVQRAQPGVGPDALDGIEPQVLMGALSTAVEISSPPKHFLLKHAGLLPS
jgi:hypothetical protein